MNNTFINTLMTKLANDSNIETILTMDKTYKLNDIISYLEKLATELIIPQITNNIIITEGNILDTIKIINIIYYNPQNYILFINDTNNLTNTYLIDLANKIYEELKIESHITIDYSKNYNNYLNNSVTLIGSKDFIITTKIDFLNPEIIELF